MAEKCTVIEKKGSEMMTKPKNNLIEKTLVFNRQIFIFLAAFVVCLSFSIDFFKSGDIEIGVVLLIIALAMSLGVFFSPLYFVFTKEELTAIWLFQHRRVIPWYAVKSIIELKWGEVYKDLPKYELIYHLNYKGHIISKQFDIPRNKRTKQMIEKYAKHKIV